MNKSLRILILIPVFLSVLILFQSRIHADANTTLTSSQQASLTDECERRNIRYSCNPGCDCRNFKGNELMCGQKTPLTGEVPSLAECNYTLTPNSTSNTTPISVTVPGVVGSTSDSNFIFSFSNGTINIVQTVANIVRIILAFTCIVAFVIGLFGAYTYSTAGGDSAKTEEAVKIFRNALIGFILSLGAFGLTLFFSNVFNFGNSNLPTSNKDDNQTLKNFIITK